MPAKKLPKSIGACADLLFDTREKRLAADRVAKELKSEEERIKTHIIDNLDKRSETGAAGKHHRVQVVTKTKYHIESEKWGDFFTWVGKNKAWDVLQKRISEDALIERLANSRAKPPGVGTFNAVTVSLTKV